tara:strand:+ start:83 stop:280 length:198 start_codon:yes stop_codon:yes gene_type:complete
MKMSRDTVVKRKTSSRIEEEGKTVLGAGLSAASNRSARGARASKSDCLFGGSESHKHKNKFMRLR